MVTTYEACETPEDVDALLAWVKSEYVAAVPHSVFTAVLEDYREVLAAYIERRDEAIALRAARDSVPWQHHSPVVVPVVT